MNRLVELEPRLPHKGPKTGLAGTDQELVYRFEKHDMTVTLPCRGCQDCVVELALGTEARHFSLSELIHFWLTIIEVGLKGDIAELESREVLRRSKKRKL